MSKGSFVRVSNSRHSLHFALALALTASGAHAETALRQNCALVGGALPDDCRQANHGTVIARPLAPNLEPDTGAGATGDLGFSISVDPVGVSDATKGERTTIAGESLRHDTTRDIDRLFEQLGVQMSYDGLGARPALNVSTFDLRRSYAAGDPVRFRSYSNYPAWINRAEVRIVDRDNPAGAVTVLPVAANGTVEWVMPGTGAERLQYSLRVYDAAGRFDETVALPIDRSAVRGSDLVLNGSIVAAGEGEDRTARRRIPVRGGAVTVSGQDVPAGTTIRVMGETVTPDIRRAFVIQRILPPGDHDVKLSVESGYAGKRDMVRQIDIPKSEWFYTGIADLTLGRDLQDNDNFSYGRIAGFAQGNLANGVRITASVDTREEELKDLFSNFGRKRTNQVLDQIQPDDVFTVYGDDSVAENLAPTSGKFYLRVDKDQSHLLWGDFKASEDLSRIVRSDRTLYGLQGNYVSNDVTTNGDARFRLSGFAAQPDSLVERDVLRGTGGTSYFLGRRDLLKGTETLIVEVRDPVSQRVVSSRRLTLGRDYRIEYVQGVIFLTEPLSPTAAGPGLNNDRPLGDYDVVLVAQYEYVPTTGTVDGVSVGGRAEAWATNSLRFGVSGVRDTTGVADTTLYGADILWRHSDATFLSFDYATSEGPGFGSTNSLNAGLTLDPEPTVGVTGERADAFRLEGRADLAEIGGDGFVAGYYDSKEAGFVSPDQNIAVGQETWGIDGKVGVAKEAYLTFGYDRFSNEDGKRRSDGRVGVEWALSQKLLLEAELSRTDRSTPGSLNVEDNGTRTDLGARLTYAPNEDLSVWVLGQATLGRSGEIENNNRIGIGAEARLSEKLTLGGEVSEGNLGFASEAKLTYAPNAGTSYSLGYRLDPLRRLDATEFTGKDRGAVVLGATRTINDRFTYRAENSYSAFGNEPSLASSYGVTYTPTDRWQVEGGVLFGRTRETDGTEIERNGLSLGARYAGSEAVKAGLRTELRFESSNNPSRDLDRQTYLVSGYLDQRTSDNWRLLANIDAVYSNSDQSSFRDGRYVEARIGYAYRPIETDRLNALFSYTYLLDLPGADQTNIDGDIEGPEQRSHILNAALSYDLNPQFTLGTKYGYRFRQQAARDSDTSTSSQAHLGILRLDYHVVHNWDLMLEGRATFIPQNSVQEYGALAGVYRHVGNNLRLGLGYVWGDVSDDLRTIESTREGVFVNIVGKF